MVYGIGAAGRVAFRKMTAGLQSLKGSPRSLYLVFVLKVLESYNFFSLSRILTVYLSSELGVRDVPAGSLYGAWGTLLTAYGLFLGSAVDWMGVKRSLVVCFALGTLSRAIMAATTSATVFTISLLGPNAMAGALGVPVMTIAVKRFTTQRNRGFAFSLFYTLMNLAALAQGVVVDFFRLTLHGGFNIPSLAPGSLLNNGSRLFILTGCATSFAGLMISVFLLHETRPTGAPHEKDGDALLQASTFATRAKVSICDMASSVSQSAKAVLSSKPFLQFMVMCLVTVNLKAIFRHLDATLPKYQLRAFGCSVPIGLLYSINPAMIVLLMPLVGALTTAFAHFDMIHVGAYVSAISPLWIAVFATEWSTAAFVATLSLGEAIWSPRWYDLSMSMAPDGKEGIFTALTSAPLFLAQLPTGAVSGWLLQRFCPGDGSDCGSTEESCDGRSLWTVLFALTVSSPLAITLLQRWVRPAGLSVEAAFDELEPDVDVNEADPAGLLEHVYWEGAHMEQGCNSAGGSERCGND